MYTRSYYSDDGGISIPQNYDGNLTFDSKSEDTPTVGIPKTTAQETKISPQFEPKREADEPITAEEAAAEPQKIMPTLKDGLFPFKLLPGGLKSLLNFESFHIGTEELLIIAVALFLFFSKGGDKECSLILLLLLLIN